MVYHKRNKLINNFRTIDHPLYSIYNNMKARCNNPKSTSYKNYGGRGIRIEPEWQTFEQFANDMYHSYQPGLTLERLNNNDNYCKSNCIWTTREQQCLNRRLFKNNKLKATGIYEKNNRFVAYYKGQKIAGSFTSVEDAKKARNSYINNPIQQQRKARYDSTTGVKGITPHKDGGYIIRTTKNKKRIYHGYFKTLRKAKEYLANVQT